MLCDENGYSYEWINGQKPHLIENWIRIQCKTENFVPIVVSGLSNSFSGSDSSTSRTLMKQESHSATSSRKSKPTKSLTQKKKKGNHDRTGETRVILRSRSDCKKSEKIWWMTKFQNMETLTPVPLMKYLVLKNLVT